MTALVFKTPGTIDVRAFTTMGVNAKPCTDCPIGYFGTGLKYAVAVLTRVGATVLVSSDEDTYAFETRPMDFRGAEFEQIVMKRRKWTGGPGWRWKRAQRLPYTTQYGRNWEVWMAFRELYSNTLDEGGEVYEVDDEEAEAFLAGNDTISPTTFIVVSGCEDFYAAYLDRDNIFLRKQDMKVIGGVAGQLEVLEGQADRLYYQGMRAKDIGKKTLHTYNFLSAQALTEDRQLAHEWQVRSLLANAVAQNDDEELIRSIVTAPEENWEHGLEPSSWITPSRAFHNVMVQIGAGRGGLGWSGYYRQYDARPEASKNLWRDAPRPWRQDGGDILAADGTPLFSKPFNMNEGSWGQLCHKLVEIANGFMAAEHREQLSNSEDACPHGVKLNEGTCPVLGCPSAVRVAAIERLETEVAGAGQESSAPAQDPDITDVEFANRNDDEDLPF